MRIVGGIESYSFRKRDKYNIKFICLPPNSTHPLDVCAFGPLKQYWRVVLETFRKTRLGRNEPSVPKWIFPELLSSLGTRLEPTKAKNIISGFKKCGIVPLDKTIFLAPHTSEKSHSIKMRQHWTIPLLGLLRRVVVLTL